MIYFISDLHLGHKAIIWMAHRPFEDLYHMDITLIDNWNKVIKNEDTVYFLGDFAYKVSENKIKKYLRELNGKIIFIKGNHDVLTLKANQEIKRFESVQDYFVLEHDKQSFVMFHFPLESWWHKDKGSIHLHGHIHDHKSICPHPRKFNVSAENIGYTPISIEEIIDKIENEKT